MKAPYAQGKVFPVRKRKVLDYKESCSSKNKPTLTQSLFHRRTLHNSKQNGTQMGMIYRYTRQFDATVLTRIFLYRRFLHSSSCWQSMPMIQTQCPFSVKSTGSTTMDLTLSDSRPRTVASGSRPETTTETSRESTAT